jgi:GAF domain-containing protein
MSTDRSIDPAALARSLSALRERSLDEGLGQALEHVTAAARELFSASGAGIMLTDESSGLTAVAATDEPGRWLELAQERVGEGPCVDALTFDQIMTTADLRADDRWPALLQQLPDETVRAVLGVPLHAGKIPVGSLNVYRDRPSDWHASEAAALEAYAQLVEGLLLSALRAHQHEQLVQQLQHALDHRVVIERAVGVIMGRENIDAVTAFNRIRHQARSAERRVAEVAADLLAQIPGNP